MYIISFCPNRSSYDRNQVVQVITQRRLFGLFWSLRKRRLYHPALEKQMARIVQGECCDVSNLQFCFKGTVLIFMSLNNSSFRC